MEVISKDIIFVLLKHIYQTLKTKTMRTKKPKWKHFRHLTKVAFENPLRPLVELCCSETSLDYVTEDTRRFIRGNHV